MSRANTPRIAFIGFGEAGQAIASGLRESGIEDITAWDILFPKAEGAALKESGARMGVRCAPSNTWFMYKCPLNQRPCE